MLQQFASARPLETERLLRPRQPLLLARLRRHRNGDSDSDGECGDRSDDQEQRYEEAQPSEAEARRQAQRRFVRSALQHHLDSTVLPWLATAPPTASAAEPEDGSTSDGSGGTPSSDDEPESPE